MVAREGVEVGLGNKLWYCNNCITSYLVWNAPILATTHAIYKQLVGTSQVVEGPTHLTFDGGWGTKRS